MANVCVRLDEETKQIMAAHDEINWSAVIRNYINEKIESLENRKIDIVLASKAAADLSALAAKSKKGKTGTELIREWRLKRK